MKKLAISMVVFCSVMVSSFAAWCGDNNNGTITFRGLVVLKDAGCLGSMNWNDAMARAKTLANGQCGLTDGSKAGDWRLPPVNQLKVLYEAKSQFENVWSCRCLYWSSNDDFRQNPSYVWAVNAYDGHVSIHPKGISGYVWPVRDRQ